MTALRADHIPQAVSLSAALGWPYREEDWRFAFELGHGVAVETDGGLAATALWWPYEKSFASIGMIIVAPALQGRGIGRMLMDELLRQADGRAIVLNSTREGYRLYERLGFVPCGQVNQHQAVLRLRRPSRERTALFVCFGARTSMRFAISIGVPAGCGAPGCSTRFLRSARSL